MCKPCEIGWYSAIKMSTVCIQCDQGKTTRSEASYMESQCLGTYTIYSLQTRHVVIDKTISRADKLIDCALFDKSTKIYTDVLRYVTSQLKGGGNCQRPHGFHF